MEDKTGTRKKPSAISARPVVRPAAGRSAPASATAPASQGAAQPRAENMQAIEGGGAKPGPNVKTYIERQLKSVYDDVLNQPIPDRFLDLLNELDTRAEQAKTSAPKGASKEDNE